ncbi:MAG: ATP phosphoribosyltransferase regulatory subunit [Candidatus Cloacimonetes bacterium]|nr:ATP phosphoribosyltransferase regulatory subunit [Candidatus Cloacimonadota bacterium]
MTRTEKPRHKKPLDDRTRDSQSLRVILPEDVWKWHILEELLDRVLSMYNYQEIRLSVLQDYSILHQGITALIDNKEAEHVVRQVVNLNHPDDNISLLSLRPEGTISVLHQTAQNYRRGEIHRLYYHGPMFRKNQDMQPMEFHQLGVEMLGSDSILSENEIISLGMRICRELGLRDTVLEINSYGCEWCRQGFFATVRQYVKDNHGDYCRQCHESLSENPLLMPMCQSDHCLQTTLKGPRIQDFLCDKCRLNFHKIKRIQSNLANEYRVNHHLFKHFAYYNETVFDFIVRNNNKDIIIGGGGRYDALSEATIGNKIPAVGFYLHLDRIFEIMDQRHLFIRQNDDFTVYICAQSPDLEIMMLQIVQDLHSYGIGTILGADILETETEIANAKAKHCELMIILRDENIREGKILIRNLVKEYQDYIPLNQISQEIIIARKALQHS